jgi:hypothetical protein
LKIQKLGLAFDVDTERSEAIDQETLVFVLRENQSVRKWTDACAEFTDDRVRGFPAFHPKIYGGNFASEIYNCVGQANLVI